jgi:hypothetical protein
MAVFGINGFIIGPTIAAMFIAIWHLSMTAPSRARQAHPSTCRHFLMSPSRVEVLAPTESAASCLTANKNSISAPVEDSMPSAHQG